MYQYINVYTAAIVSAIIFFLYNRMTRENKNRNEIVDSLVVGAIVVAAVKGLEFALAKRVEELTSRSLP